MTILIPKRFELLGKASREASKGSLRAWGESFVDSTQHSATFCRAWSRCQEPSAGLVAAGCAFGGVTAHQALEDDVACDRGLPCLCRCESVHHLRHGADGVMLDCPPKEQRDKLI